MPALTDLQAQVRGAVLTRDVNPLSPLLVGGESPERRLAIHARHYETSLVKALLGRFPATVWLLGSGMVTEAARRYIRSYPPTRPCLAEYGEGFPLALSTIVGVDAIPYLGDFAELEYRISEVSLEVERPAEPLTALAGVPARTLPGVRLGVQPGLRYLRASWGVDELISAYLSDSAPAHGFELSRGDVWLEIRGSRGDVAFTRLPESVFAFRASIAGGRTLGDASEQALAAEASFEIGAALAGIFSIGLVTHVPDPWTRS